MEKRLIVDEIPMTRHCPECLSKLHLVTATFSDDYEFWLYHCNVCDLDFLRLFVR